MKEGRTPSDFYFSPESKLWEIDRERALVLFGGQRAILMQIAHPLVGQAISEHSYFKTDPIKRLKRTLELTHTLVFGTREEVFRAAHAINKAHAHVKGCLKEAVGVHEAGTEYDARNPQLIQWVWATLVDSALTVQDRFIRPLSDRERETYYSEAKGLLSPLGGKPENTPASMKDFSTYIQEMIKSEKVKVGKEARDLAPYIMLQNKPIAKLFALPFSQITIGLLPKELREQYGFSFSPREQKRLDQVSSISRKIHPYIPPKLRFSPEYLKARKG